MLNKSMIKNKFRNIVLSHRSSHSRELQNFQGTQNKGGKFREVTLCILVLLSYGVTALASRCINNCSGMSHHENNYTTANNSTSSITSSLRNRLSKFTPEEIKQATTLAKETRKHLESEGVESIHVLGLTLYIDSLSSIEPRLSKSFAQKYLQALIQITSRVNNSFWNQVLEVFEKACSGLSSANVLTVVR